MACSYNYFTTVHNVSTFLFRYTERLDPLRLISEIIAFLAVMSYGLAEINEIRMWVQHSHNTKC